jgi:hypothetical protein
MNRKTARATLTAFLRIKEKSTSVDEIAALAGFLKHLGLHTLQLVRGE